MPQRFLRPGITTSKKWDACSWLGQSFYIRILTLVDDYGRYDADPTILRSHAFPLREDIRTGKVLELMRELEASHLAHFYKVDGKCYVQLWNWQETPRAAKSRFPEWKISKNETCEQMFPDVCKCSPPSFLVPRSPPPSSPSCGAPTLEESIEIVRAMREQNPKECDYTDAEVKAAWNSLEAGKDPWGRWKWGKNSTIPPGDPRAALEARINDKRDNRSSNGRHTKPHVKADHSKGF